MAVILIKNSPMLLSNLVAKSPSTVNGLPQKSLARRNSTRKNIRSDVTFFGFLKDIVMTQLRYETKVPLENFQLLDLAASFIAIGVIQKRVFPDRVVHSIYLDTPGLDDYCDNVSGISRRSKTRLRWYNYDTNTIFLEKKKKIGRTSFKEIEKLANPGKEVPRKTSSVKNLLSTNLGESATMISYLRHPVLEVQYSRQYFEIASGIRATIDRDIRYRRLFPSKRARTSKSPVTAVLEFKYGVDQRREFLNLIRGMPFRPFRHSKYVVGLDSTDFG